MTLPQNMEPPIIIHRWTLNPPNLIESFNEKPLRQSFSNVRKATWALRVTKEGPYTLVLWNRITRNHDENGLWGP